MTSFLGKIFGGKKKEEQAAQSSAIDLAHQTLQGLLEAAQFDLSFEMHRDDKGEINIDLYGNDEELLTSKEGQLLDAIQLYIKRVVQHQLPDEKNIINMDCGGYRQAANDALLELADKLKEIALSKNKSVYFRALPPKDRKVIHQYLAEDGRVKSRSIGDGHFKKIKIYPVRAGEDQTTV